MSFYNYLFSKAVAQVKQWVAPSVVVNVMTIFMGFWEIKTL